MVFSRSPKARHFGEKALAGILEGEAAVEGRDALRAGTFRPFVFRITGAFLFLL